MWPCCNVSPLNTGPLCCMVLACSKALCLYCCWLFMATSENDGNEWWAIILKWRIILQANLSAQISSTIISSISQPGLFPCLCLETLNSTQKFCRSWSSECIIFILMCFKTRFIYNTFPCSCRLPGVLILFWFSLFPFSLHSFSYFDLLLFFTLLSTLPLRQCPIFFLPLLVSHNLFTPN